MNETIQSGAQKASVSRKAIWAGYIMSLLPVLLLLMSGIMKLMKAKVVVDGFAHLGIAEKLIYSIGALELGCTLLYIIPQTSFLGAILLTGYLGGAILAQLRVGEAIIPQILFGVLIWGGLFLRDPRLRALIPLKKRYSTAEPR